MESAVWAAIRREGLSSIMENMSSMRAEVHSLVTELLSFSYLVLACAASRVCPKMTLQP